MRYFVKMSRGEPFNLYRFNIITEERWYPTQGWTPTRNISAYLVMGEGDYEEITESLAEESFPDAFAVIKSIGAYEVSKAEEAKRYTLGAMYIPDRIDAHGEWTDADELQRAVWDYVKSNDRRIRLQHDRDTVAGEWVEVMAFPYELTVPIKTLSGLEVSHTYPAEHSISWSYLGTLGLGESSSLAKFLAIQSAVRQSAYMSIWKKLRKKMVLESIVSMLIQ
jgi:hypothetical protein